MLFQVVTENGVKTIKALTADTGTGAPVGSLISMYKKSSPSGYLYCDGSTFDETAYPALYQYLGSNVLPDYREFALVGAEENTTDVYNASTNPNGTIHDHDVYTEGQAKDDQLQDHYHQEWATDFQVSSQKYDVLPSTASLTYKVAKNWNVLNGRTGTTTHGKRKAVYFYIKATSGLTENQQENVLNTINENLSYSTEEHATGKKWIDGKPIYSKTIDFGVLPNNTIKNVNHGITNLDKFTSILGITTNGINTFTLPYVNPQENIYSITVYTTSTQITVLTGTDRSGFTSTQVTLEYTKTND